MNVEICLPPCDIWQSHRGAQGDGVAMELCLGHLGRFRRLLWSHCRGNYAAHVCWCVCTARERLPCMSALSSASSLMLLPLCWCAFPFFACAGVDCNVNIASKERLLRHLDNYAHLADGIITPREQRHFTDKGDLMRRLDDWVAEEYEKRRGSGSSSENAKELVSLTEALSRRNSSVANERFIF